jgi:hypothetical protein
MENRIIEIFCRGDIDLRGETRDDLHVSEHAQVSYESDRIHVQAQRDVRVQVPAYATVVLESHGDTSVKHLIGPLQVKRVRQDLSLEKCGPVTVDRVDGDVSCEDVHGELNIATIGGDLEIRDALQPVTITTVAGDADIHGCRALKINTIGSSLELEDVKGDVQLRQIGDGLDASEIRGGLMCDQIGGDATCTEIMGNITLGNTGGDLLIVGSSGTLDIGNVGGDFSLDGKTRGQMLRLGNVGGDIDSGSAWLSEPCQINAGGDIELNLNPQGDGRYSLHAGGDITLNLSPDANATVTALTGEGRQVLRVGEGRATISIRCGGSVDLRGASRVDVRRETRDRERNRKMGAFKIKLPDVAFVPPVPPVPVDEISGAINRAMSRVNEHLAEVNDQLRRRTDAFKGDATGGTFTSDTSDTSDADTTDTQKAETTQPSAEQERLAILRMLAEKKVTVEQAERLLAALD